MAKKVLHKKFFKEFEDCSSDTKFEIMTVIKKLGFKWADPCVECGNEVPNHLGYKYRSRCGRCRKKLEQ